MAELLRGCEAKGGHGDDEAKAGREGKQNKWESEKEDVLGYLWETKFPPFPLLMLRPSLIRLTEEMINDFCFIHESYQYVRHQNTAQNTHQENTFLLSCLLITVVNILVTCSLLMCY